MENASSPPVPEAVPRPRTARPPLLTMLWVAAAVVLVLLAWQWIETRARLEVLQQQVAQRLGEADAATREARSQSREVADKQQTQANRIAVLEARLSEAQGQQAALEALYQDFSRSRDEWLLAEVEQALNIAQQQLQLAGNVSAALIALQSADQRLSGLNRPQLLPLRKSIARDLDRLKALPLADVSSLGLTLENLIERIDTLPLAFEHSPRVEKRARQAAKAARADAKAAASSPTLNGRPMDDEPSWLSQLGGDLWSEVQQVIRIERLDRPDPALLAPSQAVFLRENLRLRLLSARLALLQRDGRSFRDDTRLAAQWLERYFDTTDRDVMQRLTDLRRMQTVKLSLELPSLDQTMSALRNVRLAAAPR